MELVILQQHRILLVNTALDVYSYFFTAPPTNNKEHWLRAARRHLTEINCHEKQGVGSKLSVIYRYNTLHGINTHSLAALCSLVELWEGWFLHHFCF